MYPVDVVIILSIGNIVAWMVGIYVKNAMSGLMGHVVISNIGAFIAGYLTLKFTPELGVVGMIPAAFVGAGLLLYLVRFRKWGRHRKDP